VSALASRPARSSSLAYTATLPRGMRRNLIAQPLRHPLVHPEEI